MTIILETRRLILRRQVLEDLDALWAIYCRSFVGPTRAAEAKRMRDIMAQRTSMKQWHVIHLEEESTLYYGFYRSIQEDSPDSKDRRDAEKAKEDLKKVRVKLTRDLVSDEDVASRH